MSVVCSLPAVSLIQEWQPSMFESRSNVIQLRELLGERFPHLRFTLNSPPRAHTFALGAESLDSVLGGGLAQGKLTEFVARENGSGSVEVIHAFLDRVAKNRQFLALVDGLGSFDPSAVAPAVLTRLLWVRCDNVTQALKATDLLLRDRNFPFLLLDLKLNPVRELRKIPASTWHRYARLLEYNGATVVVVSPFPLATVAHDRIVPQSSLGSASLEQSTAERLKHLRFTLLRSGLEIREEGAAEAG